MYDINDKIDKMLMKLSPSEFEYVKERLLSDIRSRKGEKNLDLKVEESGVTEELDYFKIDCNSPMGKHFVNAMICYIDKSTNSPVLSPSFRNFIDKNFEAYFLVIKRQDKFDYRSPDGPIKKLIDKLTEGWEIILARNDFEIDSILLVLGINFNQKNDDKEKANG